MNNIWNKWLKKILFVYCGIYTLATIASSISYLSKGIYEDPAGNWHELDRAVVALIIVTAYALIKYLKISNFILKTICVYIPTMLLSILYVFLRGMTSELAATAYRDIFINYTVGFIIVSLIAFVSKSIFKRKK